MKQKYKFLIIPILILCGCIAVYIAVAFYFRGCFGPNIWINGIYCTGKTVEDVEQELLETAQLPEKFILTGYLSTEHTKETQEFSLADIGYSISFSDDLNSCMNHQTIWEWPLDLIHSQGFQLFPRYSFDEQRLESCLQTLTVYTQEGMPEDYYIQYEGGGQGYTLYDGMAKRLDREAADRLIKEALLMGVSEVNLIEKECYYDAVLTSEQEAAKKLWRKLSTFQKGGPSYDFEEEQLLVSPDDMVSFLQKGANQLPITDESGLFVVKEEAVAQFVEKMADQYDTYKKDWSFASTRGDTVNVPGVTYGGIIDREAEILWLTDYLNRLIQGRWISQEEKLHIPAYQQKPYYRGKNTVGSTYIEVDMTEQKLYYYEEGKMTLETDVVTGSVKQKRATPEGVNFVYGKQQNRTLRGPGYATFVKFWMPVKGNIGLHDATWRSEFGGDIYLTDGSHGCVNLPVEKAVVLYEEVEIGTPVVMFY